MYSCAAESKLVFRDVLVDRELWCARCSSCSVRLVLLAVVVCDYCLSRPAAALNIAALPALPADAGLQSPISIHPVCVVGWPRPQLGQAWSELGSCAG